MMYKKGDKVRVKDTTGIVLAKAPGVYVAVDDILIVIKEVDHWAGAYIVFEAKGLCITLGSLAFLDAQAIPIDRIEPYPNTPPFKKGDRAKYKGGHPTASFAPDGTRYVKEGDIVEVLRCDQMPPTSYTPLRWYVCYSCPSHSCSTTYLGIVQDAQCVWADTLELEASTTNQVIADDAKVCTCSRTTLLRYGCTCGSIKKYKVPL